MPSQTNSIKRDSDFTLSRKVLLKSWDQHAATGTINGEKRQITPFRAATHMGDFLNRLDGDKTKSDKVPVSSGNNRHVPDSSDYIRFKKLRAMNQQW
tara:strand:+ start:96 stop:386 length:291 start_codon:yes stop_codon:yes gene_type:complete